jgi:hypothetical protein
MTISPLTPDSIWNVWSIQDGKWVVEDSAFPVEDPYVINVWGPPGSQPSIDEMKNLIALVEERDLLESQVSSSG